MKAYELLFFVSPTLEEEEREATMTRVNDTISNQGGVIDNIDNWGRRKLAYEVEKLAEGDYTLLDFHAEPSTLSEINRVLRLDRKST
ncbi:MAG: 30S ribosomal protein S6, partial [Coriobacteriales bacterium]|nr:30S ribosomal protein S6 [Coriobacteriales bacterium]